ncbi:MAG: hypothetical protein HUJ30_09225, partial [Gammaproteobacteria bacterium]|nr:hypothetical protein [Gammaproteobacteria bacterium]
MHTLTKIGTVALLATVFTGCSETTTPEDGPGVATRVTLSGAVADGYISGATVCLDINENKKCDADEPSATTDVNGNYSFEATSDVANGYPIVAVVPAGATDADRPGETLQPFVLTAPAGKPEFVSPLTTMVQSKIETEKVSATEAEDAIKATLGYGVGDDVSLFTDYVAAKDDTTNTSAEHYARIHKVAQVTTRVLEANYTAVETAATDAGLNLNEVLDELVNIIVQQVIAELSTISTSVDTAGDTFNADTVASSTEITDATTVDTTTIEEDVIYQQNLEASAIADLGAVIQNGFFGFGGDYDWSTSTAFVGYEEIIDANLDGQFDSNDRYFYDKSISNWQLGSGDDTEYCI